MDYYKNEKEIWKGGTVLYPIPSVMVSCGNKEDKSVNIITIAWTGIINSNPPKTYVSIKPSRASFDIIKEKKEFVINLTNKELTFATDFCGVKSKRDVNKFKSLNLTPMESKKISCPSILESPVNIECTVFDIYDLPSHSMFMADIVSVSTEKSLFDEDNKFNLNLTKPLCYSHGSYYTIGELVGTFGYSVKKK